MPPFNLKGSLYLLQAWMPGYIPCVVTPVPFERLDLVGDNAAISCHEEPPPPWLYYPSARPYRFPFSGHFVADDELVLFNEGLIEVFTPPRDNSGVGKWTVLNIDVLDIERSFYSYSGDVPKTGIILSGSGSAAENSLRVLLSFHTFCPDIEKTNKMILPEFIDDSCEPPVINIGYEICAYVIDKNKFHPLSFQKLDASLFSDMLPKDPKGRIGLGSVSQHLLDLGEGAQDGSRRICAILTADSVVDQIPLLFLSIFDVQLIEPLPAAGSDPVNFVKADKPIKKLACGIDMGKGFQFHDRLLLDAFLI